MTMEVLYNAGGEFKFKTVPIPTITKPNEVIVEVKAAGLCGTDLEILHQRVQFPTGVTLGHEISGIVTETGEDCKVIKKWDRVALDSLGHCGACLHCKTSRRNFCIHGGVENALGLSKDGGFAKFVKTKEANCLKIPDSITFEQACLVEPYSTILHLMKRAHPIEKYFNVLIFGAGTVGTLAALNLYHNMPDISVVVCDISEKRRKVLEDQGIETVKVVDSDYLEKELLLNISNPEYGYDCIFELSGSVSALKLGFKLLAKRGKLLMFGVVDAKSSHIFNPAEIFFKELTIAASLSGPDEIMPAVEEIEALSKKNLLNLEKLNVRNIPLSEFFSGLSDFINHEVTKVIIKP